MLQNAWDGYNSTLFAYGQTGSGKSWSMVGYGVNKGTQIQIGIPFFAKLYTHDKIVCLENKNLCSK